MCHNKDPAQPKGKNKQKENEDDGLLSISCRVLQQRLWSWTTGSKSCTQLDIVVTSIIIVIILCLLSPA